MAELYRNRAGVRETEAQSLERRWLRKRVQWGVLGEVTGDGQCMLGDLVNIILIC